MRQISGPGFSRQVIGGFSFGTVVPLSSTIHPPAGLRLVSSHSMNLPMSLSLAHPTSLIRGARLASLMVMSWWAAFSGSLGFAGPSSVALKVFRKTEASWLSICPRMIDMDTLTTSSSSISPSSITSKEKVWRALVILPSGLGLMLPGHAGCQRISAPMVPLPGKDDGGGLMLGLRRSPSGGMTRGLGVM